MLALLGPTGLARLFFVTDELDRPVAGTIVLFEPRGAVYAYSASSPLRRHDRPNDLMLYRLILWLIGRGIPQLDLGSDSPVQKGLLFFKRKWFARQKPIPFYYLGNLKPEATDSSASRFDPARRILRLVPLSVSRLLAAPLTRYFG